MRLSAFSPWLRQDSQTLSHEFCRCRYGLRFFHPKSRPWDNCGGGDNSPFVGQPEAIAITLPLQRPKNLSLFQLPFPVGVKRDGFRVLFGTRVDDEPLPIVRNIVLAVAVMYISDGASE
jgi:hypothetical protein